MGLKCLVCQCKTHCQIRKGCVEKDKCTGCCHPPMHKHYFIRMRHAVYIILAIALVAGIIGPFIWQCIEKNANAEKALSIWNGFVSISIGFVATALSIVSLAMNFKTYDDALRVQESAIKTLESIKTIQNDMQEIKKGTSSLQGSGGSTVQSTTAKINSAPTAEPEAK